jgi:hypothetical protein
MAAVQSAKADFANFQRRIHSLRRADGAEKTGSDPQMPIIRAGEGGTAPVGSPSAVHRPKAEDS